MKTKVCFAAFFVVFLLTTGCNNPFALTEERSGSNDLTSFSFEASDNYNALLGRTCQGSINGTIIDVKVTFRTDLSKLKAAFRTNGSYVKVGDIKQTSTSTSNDFTAQIKYKVYAVDKTTKEYTINVTREQYPKVSTFAGIPGNPGATGSDPTLYSPIGITSPDGIYLYSVDGHNRIRRITISTGEIITVVGQFDNPGTVDGIGTAALLNGAWGLTNDGTYLYETSMVDHAIRRISLSDYKVETIAGLPGVSGSTDNTGANARFFQPTCITTDGVFLYICDYSNCTIRKMNISTRAVTTLAGSAGVNGNVDGIGASASFSNMTGITVLGNYLYVADRGNNIIRKIEKNTGVVTTIAGVKGSTGSNDGIGTSARFLNPHAITNDGKYLYITDRVNYTIRRMDLITNEVTTIAGKVGVYAPYTDAVGLNATFYCSEGILCVGPWIYVADLYNNTIRKLE